jgi:LuxR family maltose regulon positive regulatory protein
LLLLACLAISVKGRAARGDAGLAELGISDDAARRPDIAAGLALARAVIALQRDDTSRTIELLEGRTFHPVDNPFMHYLMLSALAIAYAGAGRYADAKVLLADHPIPPKDINNDMAILAESAGALTSLLEGDVREAERLASPLLERALKTFGHRSVCANVCSAFLADAFYELNRIDDARETLANRHGLLESSSIEVTVRASLCRARLDLLQTGPDAALAFLRTQSARFRSLDYDRPMVLMLAEQVKINLIKGDRTEANASLQALDDCARAHAHSRGFLVEIPAAAALARARLLLADDPALALQALEDARRHALSLGRGTLLTLVDLLSARALADLGCHDRAMASRTQAVLSGCRNGLFRTFVDEGALAHGELAALVQADTLQEPARQFARDLLAGFPMLTAQSTGAPTQKGASARNGQTPLTQREIEILSLVAQAMSNKRIALALNITVETVKWNLRNIFAKLGVSSRYDAMVWARNHKLIR